MKTKFLILIPFLILSFTLKPFYASALSLYVQRPAANIKAGDKVTLKVFVNTEGQEINVLEGGIKISGPVTISNIDKEGSVFDLWTEEPKYLGQNISFTGGVGGGVYGKDLKVFSFDLNPTLAGNISIEPTESSGYLNDGHGSKVSVVGKKLELVVLNQDGSMPTENNSTAHPNRIILISILLLLIIFSGYKYKKSKLKN